MELKIIIENQNPLFNRKEIEGEIKAEVTPSRAEVRKILSEKYSVPEETIKIRTIKGAYGSRTFLLVANIYKSKQDKDKVEQVKKKDLEAEKKKVESEEKSEETPEQKPTEETSEKTITQSTNNPQQETSDESLNTKENPESQGEDNKK